MRVSLRVSPVITALESHLGDPLGISLDVSLRIPVEARNYLIQKLHYIFHQKFRCRTRQAAREFRLMFRFQGFRSYVKHPLEVPLDSIEHSATSLVGTSLRISIEFFGSFSSLVLIKNLR